MNQFVEFLRINELTQREIAEFLGVQEPYISKICNGYLNLPKKRKLQLLGNSCGWDTTPLEGHIVQTIGNHSNNNTQSAGDCELWKKLCEEKDKRIAELERTIQILMSK